MIRLHHRFRLRPGRNGLATPGARDLVESLMQAARLNAGQVREVFPATEDEAGQHVPHAKLPFRVVFPERPFRPLIKTQS
jgi:hypothetical protein